MTICSVAITHAEEMFIVLLKAFNVGSQYIAILVYFGWILGIKANAGGKGIFGDDVALNISWRHWWLLFIVFSNSFKDWLTFRI